MKIFGHITAVVLTLGLAGSAQADTVGLGTMPQGTLGYSTGSAIARVMNEQMDIGAIVQPNSGETTLIPLVNSGELDFGVVNVLEAAQAYGGEGVFEGNPQENLRVASVLYPLRVGYFVRADSDIHTMADLRGKRVTYGYSATGSTYVVLDALLANGGLSADDIRPVLVPNVVAGADQFLNGRADAFFFAIGAAKTAEVNASVPLRLIPLDDSSEGEANSRNVFPDGYLITVPALPNFAGVAEPMPALAYDNLLITNDGVDAELIANVLTGLAENKDDLAASFPLFRSLDPELLYKEGLAAPFHPATVNWASGGN
ncbi:TAXI family TRAP transporter solute-binding subunit [Thalassovita taeanensis]|uniref:TRAP transporter solute receptor, TAXI family n=1 Tax=Thalassovita taeanensis TaxID=657014 RepID=A0A1H9IYA8_9RHOB|nr:TAXI family TRAP transporter solute-binding subunit [Thalassovita taeanensis]SEQ79488.1 hypothetical protein SAMN04488092_11367 [Thalassovita taeanensis]